jgi:hypothetical protein
MPVIMGHAMVNATIDNIRSLTKNRTDKIFSTQEYVNLRKTKSQMNVQDRGDCPPDFLRMRGL